MQSTEQKYPFRTLLFLFIAIGCSLILTYLTITPPVIPTDWARLDTNGVYVPMRVDYAWPSYGVQVGLWVMIAVSFQLSAVSKNEKQDINRKDAEDAERSSKKKSYILWLVAGITLVGFGLRVHGLYRLPLIIDEIGFAAHASDILHGQQVPIFAPGHNANPSVYSWLMAGIMAVLGQNTFAMRLLPLIFGTLSIPAIYVLGREWWSRRVGLMAAIFLATYPAHIFFSRMSLYNIVDPFFAMLALAFLARAMRFSSQRRYWILAGMMVGIAQYFYHGSRLVLVAMAVYVGLSAMGSKLPVASRTYGIPFGHQLPEKDKAKDKQKALTAEAQRTQREKIRDAGWWRGVAWMVFTFAVVALPRFAPMLVNSLPVTGNEQSLHLPADFGANSLRSVLAWVGQKDVSPFWLSDALLLEKSAFVAFGLGILVCLWRWREARSWVLLVSVVLTTIFGGAIWAAAPLYVRYMTAVPAIALLVGIGIENLNNISQRRRDTEKQSRNTGWVSFQTILIILIAAQGIYGAAKQPEEALGRITEIQWIEEDLAQQAAALPEGEAAVLIVPEDFDPIQRITIAHYVAALGERRMVVVSKDDNFSDEQLTHLNGLLYNLIKPR